MHAKSQNREIETELNFFECKMCSVFFESCVLHIHESIFTGRDNGANLGFYDIEKNDYL